MINAAGGVRFAAAFIESLDMRASLHALTMYMFSERLALIAGVVLPVGETLRRWGTWWDVPLAYFDDVFLGVFFLIAAARSRRGDATGSRWLAASFGLGCGMAYSSWVFTMGQLERIDPSGLSGATAATVKVAMLGLSVAGLVGTLRGRPHQR